MDIPAISTGLAGTAAAIQRGQKSFDDRAQQVTADSLAMADPGPDQGSSGDLAGDVVGLQADAISNSILYKVFQRQAEQQREAADLLRPKS